LNNRGLTGGTRSAPQEEARTDDSKRPNKEKKKKKNAYKKRTTIAWPQKRVTLILGEKMSFLRDGTGGEGSKAGSLILHHWYGKREDLSSHSR